MLFDDASRCFALAETVDLELVLGRLISLDLRVFKLLRRKFHREFYIVVFS